MTKQQTHSDQSVWENMAKESLAKCDFDSEEEVYAYQEGHSDAIYFVEKNLKYVPKVKKLLEYIENAPCEYNSEETTVGKTYYHRIDCYKCNLLKDFE